MQISYNLSAILYFLVWLDLKLKAINIFKATSKFASRTTHWGQNSFVSA